MEKSVSKNNLIVLIVILFFALLLVSVVALPWATELHEIPTTDVAEGLFKDFGFAFVILGMVLASAILGGIYLAKADDGGEK